MPQDTLIPTNTNSFEKPRGANFTWLWLMIVIMVAVIFWVLVDFCQVQPWWLALIILIDYLLLLLINYLNKFKKKLGWLFTILLAMLPALVVVVCGGWAWWLWLLIIALFLLILIFYFIGLLSGNYWLVAVPLSILLVLMLICL